LRIADTIRIFAKNGLDFFFSDSSAVSGNDKNTRENIAELLRKSFEELGATYIKLGQLMASAPGLFPEEFVKEMQRCLDNVAPLSFRAVEKVLHEEFHGHEKNLFLDIDPIPIASASIAQVHGATYYTGEKVVIKVQRPGIEKTLNADLNLLFIATAIFERLAPGSARTSLTGIVKDFHKILMEEVDFIKESQNIILFQEFLDNIGEKNVIVPRVFHEATSKKVLTMERLYGVALTDIEAIRKYVNNPEDALILALNTWFQSLMFCGFFHADVHAGNIMVLDDGKVAYIDFGIVGRMDQKIWTALLCLVEALGNQNYTQMAKALVELNATSGDVDINKFSKQLEKIFKDFNVIGNQIIDEGTIDEAGINNLMLELTAVSEQNGLKFPREFALLFKQFLYFDRYVKILAPELNIINSDQIRMMPGRPATGR
jgi:predicted unusual protein kinase regulating ubiquinone biosynthesis (AarF/ABC1/UbiB family)